MGLMDRWRSRAKGDDADEDDTGTPPPVDVAARSAQLIELDDALRTLAREMAADGDRMSNPGWSGKVADYRAVAAESATLERDGFDRASLTDLVSQVVPLPSDFADPSDRLLPPCVARTERTGSFVVEGRDSGASPPDGPLAPSDPANERERRNGAPPACPSGQESS